MQLEEGIWIHGVSFPGRHVTDSLLPRFSAPVVGAVNIAMLHTSLAGSTGHDVYAPCSVADLAQMGFDYWALGNVHRRQVHAQDPWIVMPGMPQGRDMGEVGPKSATLLTIANGRIEAEEVQTSSAEFRTRTLDVPGTEGDDELRLYLRTHLQNEAEALQSPVGVLRLSLVGAPPPVTGRSCVIGMFGPNRMQSWRVTRVCSGWTDWFSTSTSPVRRRVLPAPSPSLLVSWPRSAPNQVLPRSHEPKWRLFCRTCRLQSARSSIPMRLGPKSSPTDWRRSVRSGSSRA